MYEVDFLDGEVRPYAANIIANTIWSQVDIEGQRYAIFESIIDHHIDSTIAVLKVIIERGLRRDRRRLPDT